MEVLGALAERSVDMIFADPPYQPVVEPPRRTESGDAPA